ncbi:MAG: hypothetical protein AAGK23_04600 [Pseudomonadota bacterium]
MHVSLNRSSGPVHIHGTGHSASRLDNFLTQSLAPIALGIVSAQQITSVRDLSLQTGLSPDAILKANPELRENARLLPGDIVYLPAAIIEAEQGSISPQLPSWSGAEETSALQRLGERVGVHWRIAEQIMENGVANLSFDREDSPIVDDFQTGLSALKAFLNLDQLSVTAEIGRGDDNEIVIVNV